MTRLPLLILAALCGCDHVDRSPRPAAAEPVVEPRAAEEPYPIVEGTLVFKLGDVREIIAPADSATPGSRWLEFPVTYANASDRPVWVRGYARDFPFHGMETREGPSGAWRPVPGGYCATGARELEIPPGASHAFTAVLPERFAGQECRVSLAFRPTRESPAPLQAVSAPLRLVRPTPPSVH